MGRRMLAALRPHPRFRVATLWDPDGVALWVVDGDSETRLTFAQLAQRSVAVAQYLYSLGLRRGDRLLVVYNQAAKLKYMFGGDVKVPMTLTTAGGAGLSAGPQHSQSLEAWLAHVPGLKVVMPS